jgi:hypothetical protein
MTSTAVLPHLPTELWQRIAQDFVGPRQWSRSAAGACKAFHCIAWDTMVIDCRIAERAYEDEDEFEELCRRNVWNVGDAPVQCVWTPDCRRIPEWGLPWALSRWQHTKKLVFIYEQARSVAYFADRLCYGGALPSMGLTELHVHCEPFELRRAEVEEVGANDDDCSHEELSSLLVDCMAMMPHLKMIATGNASRPGIAEIAGRLGNSLQWYCACADAWEHDGSMCSLSGPYAPTSDSQGSMSSVSDGSASESDA